MIFLLPRFCNKTTLYTSRYKIILVTIVSSVYKSLKVSYDTLVSNFLARIWLWDDSILNRQLTDGSARFFAIRASFYF